MQKFPVSAHVAGIAAFAHLTLYPLADKAFRDMIANPLVAISMGYAGKYQTAFYCGDPDLPHSPYQHQLNGCHAVLFSRRRTGDSACCAESTDHVGTDGTPPGNMPGRADLWARAEIAPDDWSFWLRKLVISTERLHAARKARQQQSGPR